MRRSVCPGTLAGGAEADIAVLRVEKGAFGMLDSALERMPGSQRIITEMTLRKGVGLLT
jgi:hypothetical protein